MSFPWSFSFLSDFENCPRKAWHRYIAKDLPREPANEAMKWGREVHKAFEHRIGNKTPLPATMAQFEPMALAIEEQAQGKTVRVEEQIAITATGALCDDQYGKDVWGKGRLDLFMHASNVGFVLDWKTGKEREDPFELNVFGLLAKCKYPGLATVRGAYVWLKENKVGKIHDLSNFAKTWNGIKATMKTVEMLPTDSEWTANPNPLCGWCPVKTCPHNKT